MVLEKMQEYVTHLCQKYAALIVCHQMTVVRVWGNYWYLWKGRCGSTYMTEHTVCARYEMFVGRQWGICTVCDHIL